MKKSLLKYLRDLYGPDFPDHYLVEAFTQEVNRNLAEVGDSVLDLIIRKYEYKKNGATPDIIDKARQKYANRKTLQNKLNDDEDFTQFLIDNYECSSPRGKIGLQRADDFVEALIGAVFYSKGLKKAQEFSFYLLEIE